MNKYGMIQRHIEPKIRKALASKSKVIILLGARQVGKTTLLRSISW